MKKSFLILILFSFSRTLFGQINLVPNGDFEQYTNCPNGNQNFYFATGWYSACGSPDYFNVCATTPLFQIPSNFISYQWPYSGVAYGGFWGYVHNYKNTRETMGTLLASPLTVGTKYYLSYKVSLANESICSMKKVGSFFSTNKDFNLSVNNRPQCYSKVQLADTLGWMTVKDSLIADSAYNYISFGNFFSDSLTTSDTITFRPPTIQNNGSYYLIDDIRLSTDRYTAGITSVIESVKSNCNFSIFPNPVTEKINFSICKMSGSKMQLEIRNAFGELVLLRNEIDLAQQFDVSTLQEGFYFLRLETKERAFNTSFIKYGNE